MNQGKEKIITVHTFTYRYEALNSSVLLSSKVSIDVGVYKILKDNADYFFGDVLRPPVVRSSSSDKVDWWLYSKARELKESSDGASVSALLRETLLCKIIDPSFIDGYEIDPKYVKIMCCRDNKEKTTLRMPAVLCYALHSLYGETLSDLVQKEYSNIRDELETKAANYSFHFRHKLLLRVADPIIPCYPDLS